MEYEIGADESVSMAVVRAVSAVEGRDPLALRPLIDVLDPDALDTLFGAPRLGGRFTFVYSECRVTIENGEYLTLHPIHSRTRGERGFDVTDRE